MLNRRLLRIKGLSAGFALLTSLCLAAPAASDIENPGERLKELEAREAALGRALGSAEESSTVPNEMEKQPAPPQKRERTPHAIVTVKPGKKSSKEKAADADPIQKAVQKAQDTTKNVQQENFELRAKLAAAQKSYAALQENCGGARDRTAALEERAARAEEQVRALVKQLDEARARLMLAETENERLTAKYRSTGMPLPRKSESHVPVDLGSMPGTASKDMPLATVLADNAGLKTGPGMQYSTLMTVPQGTSLAVENRQGEWFRVITPLGARAWIHGSFVRLGPVRDNSGRNKMSAPRNRVPPARDGATEEAAFKSLNNALKASTSSGPEKSVNAPTHSGRAAR